MSYRLIALFVDPGSNRLGFTHYHAATLQHGALKLTEFAKTDNYPPDSLHLKTLADNAMRREWTIKVGDYAPQLDKAMRVGQRQTKEENKKDSKSLSELLIEKGPWIAPSLDPKGEHHPPKAALGPLRNLKDDGQIILERKTIFLVPDFLLDLKQETKHLSAITKAIARELKNHLDQLESTPAYSFLKLCPHRPADHLNKAGPMSDIIRHLLIETSTFFFGKEKGPQHFDKEGPLLMDGPTGTGKSMSAELIALHQGKRITKVNIAATTETLLESRMRGYKKGAFTGAHKNTDGWFAEADGGILFLDEFQNATLASQTQLLDLLDPVSNEVYISRVGEESIPRRYNVKVILAVNKPVHELLSSGRLREDLFYRIRDVVKLLSLNDLLKVGSELEPKKRLNFVRELVYLYRWKSSPVINNLTNSEFAMPFASESGCAALFPAIDDSAITEIQNYNWTGNFRQLERLICDIHWQNDIDGNSQITAATIKPLLDIENNRIGSSSATAAADSLSRNMRNRLDIVQGLLQEHNFNLRKTIEALKAENIGLGSRPSLYKFLHKHYSHLAPEIVRDSKIIKFMQGKQTPASAAITAD